MKTIRGAFCAGFVPHIDRFPLDLALFAQFTIPLIIKVDHNTGDGPVVVQCWPAR